MIDVKEIMMRAIEKYGKNAQTDMMIEEMSELTKAILKYRRNPSPETLNHIKEEMADVQIMLDQMNMIYGDNSGYRTGKLLRLASRLGMAEETEEKSERGDNGFGSSGE